VKLAGIEVVEDRTERSRCDEGFLRVSRLRLRNVYTDGSRSRSYACDVVSRPGSDAVVAVLYEIDGRRRIRVLLREGTRPPVYLRRHKAFVHPDPREYLTIAEVVAGLVEPGDGPGEAGMRRRASAEAEEEAGCRVPSEHFRAIGGETFASPGISDEKVYYCAGPAPLDQAREPAGDGSVMEEHGRLVVWELADAIERCRSGEVPDMKTEIALLRLADHLAYLPQLGCFADELPEPLRSRYRSLGVAGREERGSPPGPAPVQLDDAPDLDD
jgi:ADP-ribose pyrophosphatase